MLHEVDALLYYLSHHAVMFIMLSNDMISNTTKTLVAPEIIYYCMRFQDVQRRLFEHDLSFIAKLLPFQFINIFTKTVLQKLQKQHYRKILYIHNIFKQFNKTFPR